MTVPMRDGVGLSTDIWLPDDEGAVPALLVRLPYGKNVAPGTFSLPTVPNVFALLDSGYAVVWQDCRGTFDSEGDFVPFVDEAQDGADTIEWLRQQDWCNGDIGSYGPSYLGMTQWASASQAPDGLKAVAATFTSTDLYTAPWYSDGGAFSYHMAWQWAMAMAIRVTQNAKGDGGGPALAELVAALGNEQEHLLHLPRHQELIESVCPWWSDWVSHSTRDEFWQSLSVVDRSAEVSSPALNVGGWFDLFVNNTTRTFANMKQNAGTEDARHGQQLIIGPWDHLDQTGFYHDRQFGLAASAAGADLSGAHLRFFDRWLRGETGAPDGAPVRIFVMGLDQWRDEQDWPLPDTKYVDYYLDGDGVANTARGAGLLTPQMPRVNAVDEYLYDPADPVPTAGGRMIRPVAMNAVGPVDQRPVEARPDVLCFTTPELVEPVEVTGHITLTLYVSSSAVDTDFTGKVVDVHPDGRALYLTDGIVRARLRNSLSEPEPLVPDELYEMVVDLSVTSNVFLPGHRIRLEVSSSNFPRYDRNLNTGTADADADAVLVARNRVFRGPRHPARLTLPLIERPAPDSP